MKDQYQPVVYIESDVEQAAWIYANFGPDGTWQTVSQTMRITESGEIQEVLEIQRANGESVFVPFMEASTGSAAMLPLL